VVVSPFGGKRVGVSAWGGAPIVLVIVIVLPIFSPGGGEETNRGVAFSGQDSAPRLLFQISVSIPSLTESLSGPFEQFQNHNLAKDEKH
jgi:hypothetical protein